GRATVIVYRTTVNVRTATDDAELKRMVYAPDASVPASRTARLAPAGRTSSTMRATSRPSMSYTTSVTACSLGSVNRTTAAPDVGLGTTLARANSAGAVSPFSVTVVSVPTANTRNGSGSPVSSARIVAGSSARSPMRRVQ